MAAKQAETSDVPSQLKTPTDLGGNGVAKVVTALNILLADTFALYMKTKNFHWHMSGRHFRDYHLLLDQQSDQIFAMTDPMAERVRKIGGKTLHGTAEVHRLQRIKDNEAAYVTPPEMLAELRRDNTDMVKHMREVHEVCDDAGDVATASLLENWIDETERRAWFLFESAETERYPE